MENTTRGRRVFSRRTYCTGWPKISLVLSAIVLIMMPIRGEELHKALTIHGVLDDYQWAHSLHEFAFLFTQEGRPFLYVFNAGTMMYREKVALAEPYQYSPHTFGWLPDDSGVIIALNKLEQGNEREDHYDEFYCYTFAERNLQKVYTHIDRLFHGIHGIIFDDNSPYWAVTYAGEGHPNIAIYKEMEMILQTEVYPCSIEAIGWRHHRLYCITGAYLEFGLTREQRAQHPEFHKGMTDGRIDAKWNEQLAVYGINPVTQDAQQAAISPEDIKNTSFDTRYRITVDIAEDKEGWFFTITVLH